MFILLFIVILSVCIMHLVGLLKGTVAANGSIPSISMTHLRTTPALTPTMQAGTRFTYTGVMEG